MVFAGSKISAPAMAAAQGMRDIALHQATNKTIRPLMEHAAALSSAMGRAAAAGGAAAGSIPAGLTELAGNQLPSAPDLVPFPTVPRPKIARFAGLPPTTAAALPQATAPAVPPALTGPAGAAQAATAGEEADRRRLDPPADPAAAMTDRSTEKPAPDTAGGPAEAPDLPDKAAKTALDEVTQRLPRRIRPAKG